MQVEYDLDAKAIGKRLQIERNRCNLTQEQLAEKMDITNKYLSKIENGSSRPSLAFVMKFSDITGSDLNFILRGSYTLDTGEEDDKDSNLLKEAGVMYGGWDLPMTRRRYRICNEVLKALMDILLENNI